MSAPFFLFQTMIFAPIVGNGVGAVPCARPFLRCLVPALVNFAPLVKFPPIFVDRCARPGEYIAKPFILRMSPDVTLTNHCFSRPLHPMIHPPIVGLGVGANHQGGHKAPPLRRGRRANRRTDVGAIPCGCPFFLGGTVGCRSHRRREFHQGSEK